MKKLFVAVTAGASLLCSPALAAKKPKLTPMELQAIQSREFEATKETAFNAVMTVIQDLGYTLNTADINSGFITASSPTSNKSSFFGVLAGISATGYTNLTVSFMQMPSKMTKIRLNFVNSETASYSYGRTSRNDKPILDPAVYQNAWEKIDEALFVIGALTESPDKQSGVEAQVASQPHQESRPGDAPNKEPLETTAPYSR